MSSSRRMVFGRYDYASFITFLSYAAGSVVIPVALVAMSHDLGFSLEAGGMTAGGMLHLGRTIPLVASMLLCGFVAGRWGNRRTFGWSVLLMGLGMALCAVAPVYGILLVALMIAGVGEGVIEALATPFVSDLHPVEPGRYINFSHAFWSVGVLATVLISGALLTLDVPWRAVLGGVAALSLLPAALLIIPPRPGGQQCREHPEPLHWSVVWGHAVAVARVPRFWVFFAAMFVAGGGEFCLTFWSASYIQLRFDAAAWAGGVGTAGFAAGMVLGRTGWGYLIKQHQLRRLIVLSGVGGVAVSVFLPTAGNFWVFLALLFLSGVATAPFWPSIQSYAADRLPGNDTTMLFILLSCAGVPGCGFFTWLMGWIGDHAGEAANAAGGLGGAFYLVPACYLVLALLVGAEGLRPPRQDPASS